MNHNMTPQQLKNSILQLAIQGKLVEQRPEEGTGAELYKEIQAEKKRLVKAGKLKKEKSLPEISEDEIPFDIPESWVWVRLVDIFNLQAGKNITAGNIYVSESIDHPYLCYGGNGVRGYVTSFNREGCYAIIGRQGALCGNINVAEGRFYATEHAVVVVTKKYLVKLVSIFLKGIEFESICYCNCTTRIGCSKDQPSFDSPPAPR